MDAGILVIRTGGTIEKDYPRSIGGYAFEMDPDAAPAAKTVLERGRVHRENVPIRYETACLKDSQDISDADRLKIANLCKDSSELKIMITHGTDSLLETGQFLQAHGLGRDKRIVLTGSMVPETFKRTDADFAVGMAWCALTLETSPGIYVCVDGAAGKLGTVERNTETGRFCRN